MARVPKLERCDQCGNPTGRAGRSDDSIYITGARVDIGPLCEECLEEIVRVVREEYIGV